MTREDRKYVLVVDDDQWIAQLVKLHLQQAAYQVILAENGLQALRHLYETPVDVALVDVYLGEEYGMTLMEQLHHAYPELPVIIMTAAATAEVATEARRRGAAGYMPKPFQASELLDHVAEALTQVSRP